MEAKAVVTASAKTPERAQLEADAMEGIQALTGTSSYPAARRHLAQAARALGWQDLDQEGALEQTLALLGEMHPKNSTETMLAVQMLGVNDKALEFLQRATLPGQTTEAIDANIMRVSRLMRLFLAQLEAMAKLKGTACQQKVTVEHVNVFPGGQAIVGAIAPKLPGVEGGG